MSDSSAVIALEIHSPLMERKVDAAWVSITSPTGSFVVGPQHQPLFSLIAPGESIRYEAAGTEHTIKIEASGFCLVSRESVMILIS